MLNDTQMMVAQPFSRGPWKVDIYDPHPSSHYMIFPYDPKHPTYAVAVVEIAKHKKHAVANARLIAAAPDLYEACEAAYKNLDAHIDDPKLVEQLRTVLSKVRGETK